MTGIIWTMVNAMLVRAWQPEWEQPHNQSSGKRVASGLVLTDLALWSLTVLKLFLFGENPLSGEGEVDPGVRIVPFPCSHNAWLMTVCPALPTLQERLVGGWGGWGERPLHTHTQGWARVGCVVIATLSYSCQVFISFHSNTIRWRE